MSCQSLARSYGEEKELARCGSFHRSVRFSGSGSREGRNSHRDAGCMSISLVSPSSVERGSSAMSQSAPAPSFFNHDDDDAPPPPACRFPKLEECAHFHYERVSLGGISLELLPDAKESHEDEGQASEGWISLQVRSHVNSTLPNDNSITSDVKAHNSSWAAGSDVREWRLARNRHHFLRLDDMLHRCIYDRKVSGLANLASEITDSLLEDRGAYESLISHYLHHLSIIADDSINCGPVLNWMQMDNKGHKLLVSSEDSSCINTPAVAAAYSVRKYVSQARDEISFDVGDMISIIDMPGPQESVWWRGKRGFRVGFFPRHCVAVIGDKVPRHMSQPPPIVGSVAMAPIKPVLRKHGKLISLFRSFILSRPSRRSLKQQGILRERVFGCDLGEHLLNAGHEVPQVLVECSRAIESFGAVDGVYRLSGGAALTVRLRAAFDTGSEPDLTAPTVQADPHALASLLKCYFRELPNPLCTYQLYDTFVASVRPARDEADRLRRMKEAVAKLPPPHYRLYTGPRARSLGRKIFLMQATVDPLINATALVHKTITLAYLMRHLRRVSLLAPATGMTARNLAIVWAPNLLRCAAPHHALHGVAVQAVVTEFLICYAEELFSEDQCMDSIASCSSGSGDPEVELRRADAHSRPKSLPLSTHTKLLSLEEARKRGGRIQTVGPSSIPTTLVAPPPMPSVSLQPSISHTPNYIEVGSGPNNLPQYHTVLDFPVPGSKRGLKRSESGWRGFFTRSKLQRQRTRPCADLPIQTDLPPTQESPISITLRPVKSCESLQSENDSLPPLASTFVNQPLKQHARSASCDSYFEPWQVELADMRLRLSPQERDNNIFSEEDDTGLLHAGLGQPSSLNSTPVASELCSVEPSPIKNLRVDIHTAYEFAERKRNTIEEALSQIGYIDGGDSPRGKTGTATVTGAAPEKRGGSRPARHDVPDEPKRVCKDRDSPLSSLTDFQSSLINVKLRERNSPRKVKSHRYSGLHQPVIMTDHKPVTDKGVTEKPAIKEKPRFSWHGKDHSTLIKIDWPCDMTNINSLTNSSLNTPNTPTYDVLETDSDVSDTNKQTIKVTQDKTCRNCSEDKCLKCELNAADIETKSDVETTSYEIKTDFKIGEAVTTKLSTENMHLLQDSLESPMTDRNTNSLILTPSKVKGSFEFINDKMMSSHESSSGYSNNDELYECFSYVRPSYINLNSASTKSSPTISPLKSPIKSTISITFRSPSKEPKSPEYELITNDTPNDAESIYEDVNLDKDLAIVEYASIPLTDASLPTQEACQPTDFDVDVTIDRIDDDLTNLNQADNKLDISNFEKKNHDNVRCEMRNDMFVNADKNDNYGDSNESDFKNEEIISDILSDDCLEESKDDVLEEISQDMPLLGLTFDTNVDKNIEIRAEKDIESNKKASVSDLKQDLTEDLIILETPEPKDLDVYSQVKFFKRSIQEVNALILKSPEKEPRYYENILFTPNLPSPKRFSDDHRDYENVNVDVLKKESNKLSDYGCDFKDIPCSLPDLVHSNSKSNVKVKELATRFESPTEQKLPFSFDKNKADPKISVVDKKVEESKPKIDTKIKIYSDISPNAEKMSKNTSSLNDKTFDEGFVVKTQESDFVTHENASLTSFTHDAEIPTLFNENSTQNNDRLTEPIDNLNVNTETLTQSIKDSKNIPDLNLNLQPKEAIDALEKIDELIGKSEPIDSKFPIESDMDTLSRQRIEKYKEERRNFLREKYSSQSFRSNPEHLTRIKIKKEIDSLEFDAKIDIKDDIPKFERRNTVDLCQRAKFSLAKSATNLDDLGDRDSVNFFEESTSKGAGRICNEREEKVSPSYNIKDMTAMFEQKLQK